MKEQVFEGSPYVGQLIEDSVLKAGPLGITYLLDKSWGDAIRKSQTLKRFLLQLRKGFAPLPSIYKLPVPKGTGLFSVVSSVDSLAFDEVRAVPGQLRDFSIMVVDLEIPQIFIKLAT